jgi:hypothetical protein
MQGAAIEDSYFLVAFCKMFYEIRRNALNSIQMVPL